MASTIVGVISRRVIGDKNLSIALVSHDIVKLVCSVEAFQEVGKGICQSSDSLPSAAGSSAVCTCPFSRPGPAAFASGSHRSAWPYLRILHLPAPSAENPPHPFEGFRHLFSAHPEVLFTGCFEVLLRFLISSYFTFRVSRLR